MVFFALLSIASVLATALANSDFLSMVVHDRRSSAPEGFVRSRAAETSLNMRMRIALRQSNITGLHDELIEISTPASARYGQHLTKEQVRYFNRITPTSRMIN